MPADEACRCTRSPGASSRRPIPSSRPSPAPSAAKPEGGLLAHTNHFLDPALATGDAASTQSTTGVRLAHLRSVAPGGGSPHLADRWETLITIAMVPGAGELHWQTGMPAGVTEGTLRVFGG